MFLLDYFSTLRTTSHYHLWTLLEPLKILWLFSFFYVKFYCQSYHFSLDLFFSFFLSLSFLLFSFLLLVDIQSIDRGLRIVTNSFITHPVSMSFSHFSQSVGVSMQIPFFLRLGVKNIEKGPYSTSLFPYYPTFSQNSC